MIKKFFSRNKIQLLILIVLAFANAAYLSHDFFGWLVTLVFFLFIPGYLLLNTLGHGLKSRWIISIYSFVLSLLIFMIGGLALNCLHAFGVMRPLTTLNIFATLDVITVVLLAFNKGDRLKLPALRIRASVEQVVVALVLSLLPLLGVAAAIRLNNGVSNLLTMILFAAIPLIFLLLIWRKNLKPLYPYAIFTMGLAVLLSFSLRGWIINANDIQHEFAIFNLTLSREYWNVAIPKGDPYNACLSLTILPTIIAKITTISAAYVYKVVFQIFFALGLVPIYFLIKKLSNARFALIGALIFISFPPFLNSMPYLNRQEIAFVFFGLLMLTTFLNLKRRPKTILTILLLLGVILSHYSTGYVVLSILAISWIIFKLLRVSVHRRSEWQPFPIPALSQSIIIVGLLFTF
jgi:uncharacterized membrane protein